MHRLQSMYLKNREVVLYLIFGGLAFLVSIATFAFLHKWMGMNELIANLISWILTVSFAFFTNRIWVFSAPMKGAWEFLRQMIAFFGGRVATLLVEETILFVFIRLAGMDSMLVKTLAQIVVIVLNYVISKLVVFRKEN